MSSIICNAEGTEEGPGISESTMYMRPGRSSVSRGVSRDLSETSVTIGANFKPADIAAGGYLYKRARQSGMNWRERFFIFDEKTQRLSYFTDETAAAAGQAKDTLQLSDSTSVVPSGMKENCLEIHPGGHEDLPLYVQCSDPKMLLLWKLRFHSYIHPIKSGYLEKRARKSGRNWKKRFFMLDLTTGLLRVFENDKMDHVSTNEMLGHNYEAQKSGLKDFCIEIRCKDGSSPSLFLSAKSMKEQLEWLTAIREACRGTRSFGSPTEMSRSQFGGSGVYSILEAPSNRRPSDKKPERWKRQNQWKVPTEPEVSVSQESPRSTSGHAYISITGPRPQPGHATSVGLFPTTIIEGERVTEGGEVKGGEERVHRSHELAKRKLAFRSRISQSMPRLSFINEEGEGSGLLSLGSGKLANQQPSVEGKGFIGGHHRGKTFDLNIEKEVIVLGRNNVKGLGTITKVLSEDNFEVLLHDAKDAIEVSRKDVFVHRACDFEFTLGKRLGKGAFATVYSGMNHSTGALIAIKKMKLKFGRQNREILAQIMEEVKLLKDLEHPNIVKFLGTEFSFEDKSMYILMEQVSGGSLESAYRSFGKFSEQVIFSYTRHILKGLVYLHGSRVIHRDLKCANVLLSTAGVVKLADFGVSKKIKDINEKDQKDADSCVGSPYWMAPEVVLYQGYDTSCDIWSLGCTIVEMATAFHPWKEYDNPMSCAFAIGSTDKMPYIPDKISTELKDLIHQCLKRDKSERPTCQELMLHAGFRKSYSRRRDSRFAKIRSRAATGNPSRNAMRPSAIVVDRTRRSASTNSRRPTTPSRSQSSLVSPARSVAPIASPSVASPAISESLSATGGSNGDQIGAGITRSESKGSTNAGRS